MDDATRNLLEDVCKTLALYEPVPCPILIRVRRALAGEPVNGEHAATHIKRPDLPLPPEFPGPTWRGFLAVPDAPDAPIQTRGLNSVWVRLSDGRFEYGRPDVFDWSVRTNENRAHQITAWAPAR